MEICNRLGLSALGNQAGVTRDSEARDPMGGEESRLRWSTEVKGERWQNEWDEALLHLVAGYCSLLQLVAACCSSLQLFAWDEARHRGVANGCGFEWEFESQWGNKREGCVSSLSSPKP